MKPRVFARNELTASAVKHPIKAMNATSSASDAAIPIRTEAARQAADGIELNDAYLPHSKTISNLRSEAEAEDEPKIFERNRCANDAT